MARSPPSGGKKFFTKAPLAKRAYSQALLLKSATATKAASGTYVRVCVCVCVCGERQGSVLHGVDSCS